jgi:hypothetical protein
MSGRRARVLDAIDGLCNQTTSAAPNKIQCFRDFARAPSARLVDVLTSLGRVEADSSPRFSRGAPGRIIAA